MGWDSEFMEGYLDGGDLDVALEAWVHGRDLTDSEGRLLTECIFAIHRVMGEPAPASHKEG